MIDIFTLINVVLIAGAVSLGILVVWGVTVLRKLLKR